MPVPSRSSEVSLSQAVESMYLIMPESVVRTLLLSAIEAMVPTVRVAEI